MNINDVLQHVECLAFPNNYGFGNTVRVSRMYTYPDFTDDYWIIHIGTEMRCRWSKKDKVFCYKSDNETTEHFIDDTKFTFEEAYELARAGHLWEEHLENMRKYRVQASIEENNA